MPTGYTKDLYESKDFVLKILLCAALALVGSWAVCEFCIRRRYFKEFLPRDYGEEIGA